MKTGTKFLLVLSAVLGGLIAGCSSTSDPTTGTTATLATTTTTSTTTATTTTTLPPTTADPAEEAQTEIELAYAAGQKKFYECYETLPMCEPEEAFEEAYGGEALENLLMLANERKSEGLIFEIVGDPLLNQVEITDIVVSADLMSATSTYCTVDSHQLFTAEQDGSKIPVGLHETALVASGDMEWELGDDGQWRIVKYDAASIKSKQVPLNELAEVVAEGMPCADLE